MTTQKKQKESAESGTVLSKYIAHSGVCSRRKAEEFIQQGFVSINDEVVTKLACRVQPGDVVKVHGSLIKPVTKKFYILLNKPKDYITTASDEAGRRTVMDLLEGVMGRVYPVGRLDRHTTGVLLLTNDGELAQRLTHPRYGVQKVYHVTLDKALTARDMRAIMDGVRLEDGLVQVDEIAYVSQAQKKQVLVALHSGKYRVVRRLFEKLDYEVNKLDRVQFAGLTAKGVPSGKWRHLNPDEIRWLKELTKLAY